MKKILNKIGRLLQVVLTAPVKLPGKAVNVLKYLALGLGYIGNSHRRRETATGRAGAAGTEC